MITSKFKFHFNKKEYAKRLANILRNIAPKSYITIRRGKIVYCRYRGTIKETECLIRFFAACREERQ